MFVNATGPGKSWNLVFPSPGKKHFNVCTNPAIVCPTQAFLINVDVTMDKIVSASTCRRRLSTY